MQDIHITLQDPSLEKTLMRLTKARQQNLQDFVITALEYYIKEIEQCSNIPKLDPLQHAHAPTEPFQATSLDSATPIFQDIENSAKFGKKLRQQAWRNE